jgi:cysteine desulfuration protein SufE
MIDALTRYADDLTALMALDGEVAQFEYLIDIGQNAPIFTEQQRIKENKMSGCLAQVWIIQREDGDVFYYQGDSDAAIVKGLSIIITEIMSGHTMEEIASIKHHVVNDLGLGSGLTARRQVGMMAMIDYIKRKSGSK